VELTLPGIGDPEERLKAISERTGVQIVTGSGWYRNPVNRLPDSRMDPDREDNMVEYLIDEIDDYWSGDPNPGVIGVDRLSVSRREYWVLRVSARAQVATGLCLNTPAIRDRGLAQLDILTEEGVDLSRVVIGYGHDDSYPPLNYYLEIMDTGATVAFDNIGHPRMHESRGLGVLLGLLERGYREQVVLSQDLCYDDSLAADGYTDYAYLQREFIPKLLEAGVGEKAIHAMTVENPRRLLTRTM
jgi:phosphotriesterase-related protein